MNCPKCGGKGKVIRPYHTQENETIRHIVCTDCRHEFYSVEYEVECTSQLRADIGNIYSGLQAKYRQNRKEKLMKGTAL